MTWEEMTSIAAEEGFAAAVVTDTKDIPFDPSFRPLCAENLCGKYGANYSCPPDCGTPDEMRARIQAHRHALVLQTIWEIADYSDSKAIKAAKKSTTPRRCACSAVCAARTCPASPSGPAAAPCVRRAPSWNTSPAATRTCIIPACRPTASSCAGSRSNAAWTMTVGRACWPFSACTFLTERKETPWISSCTHPTAPPATSRRPSAS